MPLNCERKCQHICKYGDVTVICDNLKKKRTRFANIYYVCPFTVKSFNSKLYFSIYHSLFITLASPLPPTPSPAAAITDSVKEALPCPRTGPWRSVT